MADSLFKAPKGTRDLFGKEGEAFSSLEAVARHVFSLYQFSEVRTPIFESIDLFTRSLGATSDVVEKEMFVFQDRGERSFALRPEGTAGVVRHFIEQNLAVKGGFHRLFYMGPMFRAERPQAGRYRQFWQIGSEFFGPKGASADAETVLMASQIFSDFGLTGLTLQVNTLGCPLCRPNYRQALLGYLKSKENELTEESKKRMAVNPLRVLDSKVDGPKLGDAPVMKDFLCAECKSHHQQFLSMIKVGPIPFEENPRLVRGLDYYTRSVFEFISPDLGAQSAVAAGGRYDELVKSLGGPQVPGVGFALGMDRVVEAVLKKGVERKGLFPQPKKVLVIPLGEESCEASFLLADQLRKKGFSAPPVVFHKKLKDQLGSAAEEGITWAIIIGEDELKANEVTVKNLGTREQKRVPMNKIEESLC